MSKYNFSAISILLATIALATPVSAAEDGYAKLTSYIGAWSGAAALIGGEEPEPFRCRLTIAPGNEGKINYAGRCSLASMNLSVSGTIAYNAAQGRYQAVMSSNAGFTGSAVGSETDGKISFDLRERQVDRGGNDVRIGAQIILEPQAIAVNFEVEFNNSGQILTAAVPFSAAR